MIPLDWQYIQVEDHYCPLFYRKFMSSENVLQCLEQLDRFYGGVPHMIFCGDSHQLPPVGGWIWYGKITVIFGIMLSIPLLNLKGNGLLQKTTNGGGILACLHMSTSTNNDKKVINLRVVESLWVHAYDIQRSVMLPNGTRELIIEWGHFYGLDAKLLRMQGERCFTIVS
jgi:hypothetical protein